VLRPSRKGVSHGQGWRRASAGGSHVGLAVITRAPCRLWFCRYWSRSQTQVSLSGSTPAWLTDDWMCCARQAYHACSTLRANGGIVVVESNTTSGCFRSIVLWRTQGPLFGFHCIRRKKIGIPTQHCVGHVDSIGTKVGLQFCVDTQLAFRWQTTGSASLSTQHLAWHLLFTQSTLQTCIRTYSGARIILSM